MKIPLFLSIKSVRMFLNDNNEEVTAMKLRQAAVCDSEEILGIYKPYILDTTITFECEVPPIEEFRERVSRISSEYPYIVCEDKGRILGYCYGARFMQRTAFGYDAELSVYIDNSCTGRGIGSALYGAVLEILECMNIRNMYGLIACPNEASVKLHKAYGFRYAGTLEKTGFKHGKWIDLMYFERHIGDDKNVGRVRFINEVEQNTIKSILEKYGKSLR